MERKENVISSLLLEEAEKRRERSNLLIIRIEWLGLERLALKTAFMIISIAFTIVLIMNANNKEVVTVDFLAYVSLLFIGRALYAFLGRRMNKFRQEREGLFMKVRDNWL